MADQPKLAQARKSDRQIIDGIVRGIPDEIKQQYKQAFDAFQCYYESVLNKHADNPRMLQRGSGGNPMLNEGNLPEAEQKKLQELRGPLQSADQALKDSAKQSAEAYAKKEGLPNLKDPYVPTMGYDTHAVNSVKLGVASSRKCPVETSALWVSPGGP